MKFNEDIEANNNNEAGNMVMDDRGYKMPGRPPKKPSNKVGIPIRFLVTKQIADIIEANTRKEGLPTQADYLRLCLYRELARLGEVDNEIRRDATFDTLRGQGFV